VNGSGSLTAADVLLVKKRIAAIVTSFSVGDWLFNNIPVTINNGNVTQDFSGLCYGDANASYVPTAKASPDGQIVKTTNGLLAIESVNLQPGDITIPLHASNIQNLGSFQFSLSYDPQKLTFTGVDQWFGGIESVTVGNPQPGKLTFVWAADFNGISIAEGKLAELHFTSASADATSVTWGDTPTARECADYNGTIFTPTYMNGGVDNTLGLETPDTETVSIYPNPAKDFFMVKTSETMQEIQILTTSGQLIYSHPMNSKDTRISTTGFKPGLYMIHVDTRAGKIKRSLVIEK
jgi:hypothetical protein